MVSHQYSSLLSGIDYNPLLAAWPNPDIDRQLLASAPPNARLVLREAYRNFEEGYTEPEQIWGDWLALLDEFGPDDDGIQIALMGLTFLRHESRHHVDTYATPTGWMILLMVGGEYLLLRKLTEAHASAAQSDILRRIRRHLAVHHDLVEAVTTFQPGQYSLVPFIEKDLPDGIFRVRTRVEDPGLAISTIQPKHGTERALSTSALLKCRAILETAGYCAGKLRAAGASDPEVRTALELLLQLGVDPARDDYWVLLASALPARTPHDAAGHLVRNSVNKPRLMLATWFGLHVEHPVHDKPTAAWTPAVRTYFALKKLADITEERWRKPEIDWESVAAQLSEFFGDTPWQVAIGEWSSSVEDLARSAKSGNFGDGLARSHLIWLVDCTRQGLRLRGPQPLWIDQAGWPEQEDPRTVMLNADPPPAARTAWSRLTRIHRQLRNNNTDESVINLARSPFQNEHQA
jgi:hypothetical protein